MNKATAALTVVIFTWIYQTNLSGAAQAQQSLPREAPICESREPALAELLSSSQPSLGSNDVLIAGQVRRPQTYTLQGSISIRYALALAGGVRKAADRYIYILRRPSEGEARIKITFDWGSGRREAAPDTVLEKGDILYVPRRCQPALRDYLREPVHVIDPSLVRMASDHGSHLTTR